MLKEVPMYTVSCDCCGKLFEDSHSGIVAWNDPASVVFQSEEAGWLWENDEYLKGHYCPDCHEVDDNDNVKIGPKS